MKKCAYFFDARNKLNFSKWSKIQGGRAKISSGGGGGGQKIDVRNKIPPLTEILSKRDYKLIKSISI